MLKRNGVHILFVLVICLFAFFVHNRAVHVDIMESRNLVTAKEMVQYNNWLVPTMNGELRLEKPPLPTWIAAAIEACFPDRLGLQRAAGGVMATMMVFFLYFLTIALTRERLLGLLSALVLATSFSVVMMGRVVTWDIYCHSFMLGAIFFLYRAMSAKRTRWWDFAMAGIFMGLSFLGKGPVSFYALLLPFLITYIAMYRPSFRHKWWPMVMAVAICCVLSFWWPLYLYFTHPGGALGALAKESTAWLERNVRPWYYYWQFFTESGIWSLALLTALGGWYWLRKRMLFSKEYTLAVVWTLLTLVLLSLFPEKKIRYLLPLLIPASMAVGHYFFYLFSEIKSNRLSVKGKVLFRINAFFPALVAMGVPVALYLLFYAKQEMSLWLYVVISMLFLITALSITEGGIKLKPLKVFTGMMVLMILVETLLMPSLANQFNNPDKKSIRAIRDIEALHAYPFYYPEGEELRIELIYEAGRRILPCNLTDTVLLEKLPMVLVSASPAEEVLPSMLLERVDMYLVDMYDNNNWPKSSRRYSGHFLRYVTVVHKK